MGKIQRDSGKELEERIKTEGELTGAVVIRVPDKVIIAKGGKTFRKKTDFDFCVALGGRAIFLDAKRESAKDYFNFKGRLINDDKIHQWVALQNAHDKGAIAGLLIWFEGAGLYTWASVPAIRTALDRGDKSIQAGMAGFVHVSDQEPIDFKKFMEDMSG